MSNGERYSMLVNSAGIPLYYPTLYATTQIRNRSKAVATIINSLAAISVLLQFSHERGVDLNRRIQNGILLEEHEIDSIHHECQRKLLSKKNVTDNKVSVTYFSRNKFVSKSVEHHRMSVIASYLEWLCKILAPNRSDAFVASQTQVMLTSIRAKRPISKGRNEQLKENGLGHKEIELAMEVFRPDSELNPWDDYATKVRNRLIFLIILDLGIRRGEVLNIRIDDITFIGNPKINIFRRADEKSDPRKEQPLVKTNDRPLDIEPALVKRIQDYVMKYRSRVPNARKHPYLFVTHKAGPTQGMPLSISSYKSLMSIARLAAPNLRSFTGHKLRHTWNYSFSKLMDTMDNPPSEEKQTQMRNFLMGWGRGSKTGQLYNQRFIKRKAQEAGLALQTGAIRLPDGFEE